MLCLREYPRRKPRLRGRRVRFNRGAIIIETSPDIRPNVDVDFSSRQILLHTA